MNKETLDCLKFVSRILFSTHYQYSLTRSREKSKEVANNKIEIHKGKNGFGESYRCHCGTAAPSHHGGRCHRRHALALPLPTSTPSNPRVLEKTCPLPPIGRWSPQTMTPHQEDAMAARVSSMIGACALTRLHQRSGLHHGAMRGRRRVKKKKN
jgi:hypothetical protein